ncbi:MAG: mechanosensitive ion channel [Actinomyces sp.]|nr:mechanosensitive ion channel [Actinomyces sp.]
MTMTPALGALAQASDALTRAIADPQSGAEGAVATTVDLTILILGPIVGALVGVVVSVVLSIVGRKALAKSAMASSILARVRRPGHFTFAAWGAWIGLGIALVNPHLSDWEGSALTAVLMRMFLIIAIGCLTWMGYAAAWVFEDAAKARQNADQGRSRRFETRAQVLRRFTQGLIVLIGVAAAIGTFEAARHAMTTILASAGVISVIFGLAAQQTLGNVFAGMQLAFTDAIRVGDVVVAGEKKETGSVEEITLSYVVVHIWDERRLIVPCRYFTQTPFENWTRRASAQLGTVELKLDWSAPMALIRAKVEQLLNSTDLWDGRTWGVQVTDSTENTVTVRVLVSAKNSGHLSDLRAYMREQLISWIVAEQPWARPVQRIEPRQTVTVEQDMSQERIARLAAELAGISGTNEAGAAPGATASHAGSPASAGEQSGAATGGAASAISASGAAPAAPKDPIHAARMVAARRKAKRARRRAMADRQRELAEGGPSVSRDETQVISKSALRKIIEAAGNASPQLTQTLTATSVGRGERFFSGSAEAEERAAVLEGPGEEAYAEREAEARRAKERREAHKRREAEALDPETTLALAAVGVEPVAADSESPEGESPEVAQDAAEDAAAAADSAADEKAETEPEAADSEADSQPDAGASADSGDLRAAESQEDSAPAEDAEPEGAPAPDAPEETGGEEEAQASSDVEVSRDEQETTPIPARETSVKHPVQVPPPVRTGRPVMTDTVQAIAPALVPPPAPTPAEMAASRPSEDEADEPAVHPGWYAVAEEARLDAETRPTPTVQPARVSIMDFFPAVAPTGAEADMLRAVTGQIPVVEPRAPQAEDAEAAVTEKAAIDEAVAPESAAAEEPTPEVEAPEVEAEQKDAAAEEAADAEVTVVMDPVEAAEAGALNSDATQVLPAVDEPEDETLVMPAAAIADPASEAAKADEDAEPLDSATEVAAAEEEAPAKKETAKKAASTKAGAKKAPAKKTVTKKATTAKKGAKQSSAAATKTVKDEGADKASDATPAKDAKAPAKKAATKKPAAKKGTAKKAAPKKAAAKKTSNAGPATNE